MKANRLVAWALLPIVAALGCSRPAATPNPTAGTDAASVANDSPGSVEAPANTASPAASEPVVRRLPVDPMFEEAINKFLSVVERLANSSVEKYDDEFSSRVRAGETLLRQVPPATEEPMVSIRKACGTLEHDCQKLGNRVNLATMATISELRTMHLEDAHEKQLRLREGLALVKEALARGEPVLLDSQNRPKPKPE